MVSIGGPCYRNKIGLNMEQEPQQHPLADTAIPARPASPEHPEGAQAATDEPAQVIRPEDEALVVERLRDLGYIE